MKRLLIALFMMVLIPTMVSPVTQTGILIVTVTSEEGQVLPGATVKISSNVIIGTRTQQTGANGKTTFRKLPVGTYKIKASMDSFETTTTHSRVYIRKVSKVTIHLKYGPATEIIGVISKPPSVDTSSGAVSEEYNLRGSYNGIKGKAKRGIKGKARRHNDKFNTEEYSRIVENEFRSVSENPLSTLSIDVDTASYSNVRRFLFNGSMPPPDAVRIEELINYFDYDYPEPKSKHPFSITTEVSSAPWKKEHKLVHIGIQGKRLKSSERPKNNLVFLLDVSGSMSSADKLPLLKQALKLLVKKLDADDTVSIVVYAGAAGLVLTPTEGANEEKILNALDKLKAGGSTAGAEGIQLAYNVAQENFIKDGNNRIILATDGDFNIGVSSTSELIRMIEEKRKKGVYLTILGFGMGNYKDGRMEQIADKGNGNYYYIDNITEAKKVLVNDLTSTLFTIAKDVKIQIEFNPAKIQAYRLIGYENRLLRKEDFNDDTKDAGELGAGHTVTALYEIIPVGVKTDLPKVDKLRYQKKKKSDDAYKGNEMMFVKFRYKHLKSDKSILITHSIKERSVDLDNTSHNFRFSAAVASFGMMLRDSKFKGNATYSKILHMAKDSTSKDPFEYRIEFIELIKLAKKLDKKQR